MWASQAPLSDCVELSCVDAHLESSPLGGADPFHDCYEDAMVHLGGSEERRSRRKPLVRRN